MLADIPDRLGETIPNFHNMEFRLKQLRDAVAADAAGRVKEVRYFLDEIERRADEMCKAERLHRENKLPKRVCHCDTKVNNMMFDEKWQCTLCHRPRYGDAQFCTFPTLAIFCVREPIRGWKMTKTSPT